MIKLKEKLNNIELTVGSQITLAHLAIADIMAKAGFISLQFGEKRQASTKDS